MSSPEATPTDSTPTDSEAPSEPSLPAPASQVLSPAADAKAPTKTPAAAPAAKVEILFKPVGDAPIMKQKKFMVEGTWTVARLVAFVRKYLKTEPSASLHLYVQQSFAPSMHHTVDNLARCFATDAKLIIHYSTTPAWG